MRFFPEESPTIASSAQALRNGRATCRSLVERCLAQCDEWEPRIHAWVSLDREAARSRADELDREARAGHWRGPLHGIPLGIKDIIDMAGLPTGAGSHRMAATAAASDATLVWKLRNAGAILLGKTVTTQFACFDPPPTRNPWNVERTPGGSSSGSAAAVATGMCYGAIGSQTGGSITRPAAYCGVAGCKPSYGRVSLAGVVPLAPSFDSPGPIALRVADLSLLVDAIAGHDPADPHSATKVFRPLDWFPEPPRPRLLQNSPASAASSKTVRPPPCATHSSRHLAVLPPAAQCWSRPAGRRLLTTCIIATARFSFTSSPRATWSDFGKYRDDYLPGTASLVEEGAAVPEADYRDAKRAQVQAWEEADTIFGEADVLVCPAAPGPAPDLSTTGDPIFNSPWSHTGLPTVNFPIGLSPEGLPLGIQLVGRRYDESRSFQAALWCEAIGEQ